MRAHSKATQEIVGHVGGDGTQADKYSHLFTIDFLTLTCLAMSCLALSCPSLALSFHSHAHRIFNLGKAFQQIDARNCFGQTIVSRQTIERECDQKCSLVFHCSKGNFNNHNDSNKQNKSQRQRTARGRQVDESAKASVPRWLPFVGFASYRATISGPAHPPRFRMVSLL